MERKETDSQRFDYEHQSGPTKPNPIITTITKNEVRGQVINGKDCCSKHKTQRELRESQQSLNQHADRVQQLTELLTAALPALRHCYVHSLWFPKDNGIHSRFSSADESVCLYSLYRESMDALGLEHGL